MSIQNGTSLTKEALEYLVGLVRDISGLDSKLIDDINLKTNGTYSSVRIKSLIDKNLEEANKHTEDLISALNKLSSKKTNIQPTLENSEFNVIYLYSTDGNAPFEQYLKIGTNDSDAELISLGSTNISLDEYLTVLEASQTYAKQIDLDATNNSLNNHINDTDIHLTEERVTKVIKSNITTTIDENSTEEQIPTAKAVYNSLFKSDSSITNYTSQIEKNITNVQSFWSTTVKKIGNVVAFSVNITTNKVDNYTVQLGILPEAVRPNENININLISNSGKNCYIYVDTTGKFGFTMMYSTDKWVKGDGCRMYFSYLVEK